jgi:serine/threonine protein kinase
MAQTSQQHIRGSTTPHFQQQKVQIVKSQSIGEGSFGAVYKSQLDLLPCAAKTLRSELFSTISPKTSAVFGGLTIEKIEEGFERVYQLRHPNIVQFLGVYRDDETGMPVLLMELAQENLSSFIQRNPSVGNRLHIQVDIGHDVVLGLHFLHSNGIVHGNLSGNNILMFPSHRAKLGDFHSIDLPVIDQSVDGASQGLAYMAPEVFGTETRVWAEEMDIFSVGVVLMQLITGHDPQLHLPGCELELEKRYPQFNLIEKTHPLLHTISDCLTPDKTERPSTSDLCTGLTGLKAAIRAESPAKFSQRSQSIGSHLSEDESWLPVHVQVMEALEDGGRVGPVRHGFEENSFELEKPVSDIVDLPCKSEVLSMLSCTYEEEDQEKRRVGRKDAKILSKEDELLEMLRCAVEEKSRELLERGAQMEAVKRDRLELSLRLQQLQKEVMVVKSRNSRLEKELASKEKEIERLRTSAGCEFCSVVLSQ